MEKLKEEIVKVLGLSEAEFQTAVEASKKDSVSLMHAIESAFNVDEDKILTVFSSYYNTPKIDLSKTQLQISILQLIPKEIVQKYRVIPVDKVGQNIIVAMGDPRNLQALDTIRFKSGYFPKPVLASEIQISRAIDKYYRTMDVSKLHDTEISSATQINQTQARQIIGLGIEDKEDGPVIQLVNDILIQCLDRGASDIHFEVYEDFIRIRLRIDGSLMEIARPPISMKGALTSRIKIISGLNIAETRLPQDGAINITIGDKPVDFRVNCLPNTNGEKIVMRILDKSNLQVDMTKLGFDVDQLKVFTDAIKTPYGMVLVTGPTGSGKTTTLYSVLQELNTEDSNIMTAEDPVEYSITGINQSQMKPDIGLNFAAALRAFLRQDPDVIMVGEIRDLETAEIAIKAALTGHLVLSTLHTNSATETISRLLNMGVASFNVTSALVCITAQRLMRKNCTRCRVVDTDLTPEILISLGIPKQFASSVKGYKGKGCGACGNTGSKGRVAIHEVLIMNESVKKAILAGKSAGEIKLVAIKTGMKTLRQSALNKLVQGVVSASEVVQVTSADKELEN